MERCLKLRIIVLEKAIKSVSTYFHRKYGIKLTKEDLDHIGRDIANAMILSRRIYAK